MEWNLSLELIVTTVGLISAQVAAVKYLMYEMNRQRAAHDIVISTLSRQSKDHAELMLHITERYVTSKHMMQMVDLITKPMIDSISKIEISIMNARNDNHDIILDMQRKSDALLLELGQIAAVQNRTLKKRQSDKTE